MPNVREIPPIMALVRQSTDELVFRFRGGRWAGATVAGGLAFVGISCWLQFARNLPLLHVAPVYAFGVLLLYSSVYSFTADQFLEVKGANRSVRFHKKNLYGKVEWERPSSQFTAVRVFRPMAPNHRQARNWCISLECPDGLELFLGKHEFGFLNRDEAFATAENIGRLVGIEVAGEA